MTITSVRLPANGINGLFAQLQGAEGFGDLLSGLMSALRAQNPQSLAALKGQLPAEMQKLVAEQPADVMAQLLQLAKQGGQGVEGLQVLLAAKPQDLAKEFSNLVAGLKDMSGPFLNGQPAVDELAAAYQNLGYTPEDAAEKAARVTQMLALLQNVNEKAEPLTLQDMQDQEQLTQLMQKLQAAFLQQETTTAKPETAPLPDAFKPELKPEQAAASMGLYLQIAKVFAAAQQQQNSSGEEWVSRILKGEPDLQANPAKPAEAGVAAAKIGAKGTAEAAVAPAKNVGAAALAQQTSAGETAADEVLLAQQRDALAQENAQQNALRNQSKIHMPGSTATAADAAQQVAAAQVAAPQVVGDQRVLNKNDKPVKPTSRLDIAAAERPAAIEYVRTAGMERVESPRALVGRAVVQVKVADDGTSQMLDANGNVIDPANDGAMEELFSKLVDRQTQANRPGAPMTQGMNNRFAMVSQQVSFAMRNVANDGGGQVKMILNPPELGEVEIALKVQHGKVSAQISAQSAEVVEQMARDLRSLQQGLQASGFEMGEEGFTFLLKDENGGGQQQQQQQGQDDAFALLAEGEDGERSTTGVKPQTTRWVKPDSLIDQVV